MLKIHQHAVQALTEMTLFGHVSRLGHVRINNIFEHPKSKSPLGKVSLPPAVSAAINSQGSGGHDT